MTKRKTYLKPAINKVNLIPEEAVLTGCKTTGGTGGKNDRCPPVSGGCKTDSGS